jgi:Fungal specific transcription factor domain
MHGVPCSSATAKKDERVTPRVGFIHRSMIPDSEGVDESSHIVGPIVARDTHILDQYLPGTGTGGSGHVPIQPNFGRRDAGKPVYCASIPVRRPSPQDCSCSRDLPSELLEQVEPFLEKLLSAFYENVHPAFPITEEPCVAARLKEHSQLPQNFLINLIAHSLFYWDLSPALASHARPNQDFAWQVAVAANVAEIQKSDLANIIATTINVAGRPSTCLVNNTANVARMVALSHAIGLNHDCSEWKMLEQERKTRWKAWWGVVLHDRWFNFATGTPPFISKNHYDVPLPTLELLTASRSNSAKHVRAAEVYIQLCKLTEIVGDVLPLIYHIRSGNDGLAAEQTSRSEIELNRWIESRPSWLNLNEFQNRPAVPGLVNLQLCYLAVRMLLRRIAWHEISQRETDPASSWLLGCQAAAEDIVRLVVSLHKQDLRSFWLPYNAHHFTSAVTLLLRCALQTNYPEIRKQCMTSARTLVDTLRRHYDEDNWDIAETALASSENILRRIEDAVPMTPVMRDHGVMQVTNSHDRMDTSYGNGYQPGDSLQDDLFAPLQGQGSIEELFPEIFSDFQDTALFTGPGLDEFSD